jgi:ADP-ribose pyrophosphatase YjhB (NUDIX family)
MEIEVSLKAVIKNDKGEYLLIKRAHPYPGESESRWDVPGGRLIPGEKIPEALAREIKEETGMMLKSLKIINAQDILRVAGRHTLRIAFQAEAEGAIALDPKEHTEYKWLSIQDALKTHHDIYLTPVLEELKKILEFYNNNLFKEDSR